MRRQQVSWVKIQDIYLQEGLAVARIVQDDGSSSTNHSSDGYD